LPKKPAIGGMPAIENMKIAIHSAICGSVRPSPARSSTCSSGLPLRRIATSTAKVPRFITR